MGRKVVFALIMVLLVSAVPLVFLEVAVRIVSPQPEFRPRYRYSERYGHMFPESSTIINQVQGSWRFVYRTNEYGYRVSMPQISNRYDRPNIVVLGDSNAFGIGVNDGEEYPAVLAKQLAGHADIVNLGVGGFGLTHEIRTFYEFGVAFQPAIVVVHFADNDPDDNFYEMVTIVENGRFRFLRDRSMDKGFSRIKDWLGSSVIQRSAAYNFIRNFAFNTWRARVLDRETGSDRMRKETFHNELLITFAKDLHRRGIALILFDGGLGGLARWPGIRAQVEALDREGLLHYIVTDHWFTGVTDYGTPEGHPWGAKGHRVIAGHLVEPLRAALSESKMARPTR